MISALALALIFGTPLLLAVLGELVLQRAGIINIGLEGMMLMAAMTAVVVTHATGSVAAGLAGGVAGAAFVALIFGIMSISLGSDQIVTGAAVNFLALGLTGVVYKQLSAEGLLTRPLPKLPSLAVAHDPVVLFSWLIAPLLVAGFLGFTAIGLRLRGCGESPEAMRLNGWPVGRLQWLGLAIETVLAGLGGAYLSLGVSSGFAENMVAGRGFIALAIVVFARWAPLGAVAGVLLFGVTSAVQYSLQAAHSSFPYHLLLALPYVVTLLILTGFAGRVRPPESLGKNEVGVEV